MKGKLQHDLGTTTLVSYNQHQLNRAESYVPIRPKPIIGQGFWLVCFAEGFAY